MKKTCFILGVWIGLVFGANSFYPNLPKSPSIHQENTSFTTLVGLMVEFKFEEIDDPTTSGQGLMLDALDITFANTDEIDSIRCDGFLVDRPPHNSAYFESQLIAVNNYYTSVTEENISFNTLMIDSVFQLQNTMESYAHSDSSLGRLYSESIGLAKQTIENKLAEEGVNVQDVLFVVFHAGLGQDFSVPFLDPTSYDLRSAYIDEEMLDGIDKPSIYGMDISHGILLPETQNMIYFDVIEDIYVDESYCNYQFGLTGTFAFLLGYALGLPPMFDTDTGDTRIGQFGLMDVGSGNGQGVIPAPPNAWTRSHPDFGWVNAINITQEINVSDTVLEIPKRIFEEDKIYRIDIADDEYFLFENRSNNIFQNVDIDSLRWQYKVDTYTKGNYFDSIVDSLDGLKMEVDQSTGVILSFDNYDYGLPGSGILIWHIKEGNNSSNGINNDLYHRTVQLEEADGATDIGFDSYAFFSSDNPTQGTQWDYWFYGNAGYEFSNPNNNSVIFNSYSHPNSNTVEGISSNIKIEILSSIQDTMRVKISREELTSIFYLSENSKVIGSADSTVYYTVGDSIYVSTPNSVDTLTSLEYDPNKIILTFGDSVYYTTQDSIIAEFDSTLVSNDDVFPMGYIDSVENYSSNTYAQALGDVDGDGLDEIITVDNGVLSIENANGTSINGFPISEEFYGIPLIANIKTINESIPEIICRNGDHISILSNKGEVLQEIPSIDYDADLLLIPHWGSDSTVLVDGNRLIQFPFDASHSYWLGPFSRPSHYPLVTGIHGENNNLDETSFSKAYNYPNPITEGQTTFRFFTTNAQTVVINIYDVAGVKVDELSNNSLTPNEFNEIPWDASQFDSGLYFAEVKQDFGESRLIRLVIVK